MFSHRFPISISTHFTYLELSFSVSFSTSGSGEEIPAKQKKSSEGKSTANLRRFILITLSHAERECPIRSKQQIAEAILPLFHCLTVVVAMENHKEEGFHYHIAIQNSNASRYLAAKQIQSAFPGFHSTNQLNVTFFKGFANLIGYVTKEDKKPFIWNQNPNIDKKSILKIGSLARSKKKSNSNNNSISFSSSSQQPPNQHQQILVLERMRKLENWHDCLTDPILSTELLRRSYQGLRNLFDDLKVAKAKETKERSVLERIENYLRQKEEENGGKPIRPYLPEEIEEKYVLIDWIAINLLVKRPLKTKQLFLYGEPSTQKTLIFHFLSKVLRIYFVQNQLNDFSGADNFFDLWVIDDFEYFLEEDEEKNKNSTHSQTQKEFLSTLLKILDGQACQLSAKYKNSFYKNKNIPVVVICNYIPNLVNKNEALKERFIRLPFFCNIHYLSEERVIATLKQCLEQRILTIGSNFQDFELYYNTDTILSNQVYVSDGENHRGLKWNNFLELSSGISFCLTENSTLVIFLFGKDKERFYFKVQKTQRQGDRRKLTDSFSFANKEKPYFFVHALISRKTLFSNKRIDALSFACVPLPKLRVKEKSLLTEILNKTTTHFGFLNNFIGGRFQICRSEDPNEIDFLLWPMTLVFESEKSREEMVFPVSLQVRETLSSEEIHSFLQSSNYFVLKGFSYYDENFYSTLSSEEKAKTNSDSESENEDLNLLLKTLNKKVFSLKIGTSFSRYLSSESEEANSIMQQWNPWRNDD